NNEDQVLVDSTDFSMKVNGENYQEWYGESEGDSGFSHQLNKGNTGSGMITYDVPENDTYTLEMDATPNFENIKAKWNIKKEDIKKRVINKLVILYQQVMIMKVQVKQRMLKKLIPKKKMMKAMK